MAMSILFCPNVLCATYAHHYNNLCSECNGQKTSLMHESGHVLLAAVETLASVNPPIGRAKTNNHHACAQEVTATTGVKIRNGMP